VNLVVGKRKEEFNEGFQWMSRHNGVEKGVGHCEKSIGCIEDAKMEFPRLKEDFKSRVKAVK